jgi:hypothetical protein
MHGPFVGAYHKVADGQPIVVVLERGVELTLLVEVISLAPLLQLLIERRYELVRA